MDIETETPPSPDPALPRARHGGRFTDPADGAALARVSGDAPAAVLLVNLLDRSVVFANPVAQQMAPAVRLPVGLEQWSHAAALLDMDGAPLTETDHPLTRVARSEPVVGQGVSCQRASDLGERREPLWVVAVPMAGAPQLADHALVVFLPLAEREDARGTAESAARSVASEPLGPHPQLQHRAVLATGMSFTVADARVPDMPLVWVNPAFTLTTGYTFDDVVGHNCRFLQGPATDPGAHLEISRALKAGESITVTLLNYRQDTTAFWNQVTMSPIHDAHGELTHYVGIQTDVTGRVAADAERDRALSAERAARQEAETARASLALLAEATGALATSLDITECRQRLAELCVPALADWVLVVGCETDDGRTEVTLRHHDPGASHDQSFSHDQGVSQEPVLSTAIGTTARALCGSSGARALEPEDIDVLGRSLGPSLGRSLGPSLGRSLGPSLGGASVMVVPVPGRNGRDDVIVLVREAGSAAHTDDDLAVAVDLGRRAGLILDNARLYQSQHAIAETLQRSLLPRLPIPLGVAAAARYLPGAAGADVGGDFYEVIAMPDSSIGIAVGDVMGHDVLAAAAMGHLRGLLRASAYDPRAAVRPGPSGHDPLSVLTRVDLLVQGLDSDILATLAYARLRPLADGEWSLVYASAGHLPLILRHADGRVELLEDSAGLMLGVARDTRSAGERILTRGSVIIAYTDGLVERRGEDLRWGLERLVEAVSAVPTPTLPSGCADHRSRLDPESVCDHLLARCVDPSRPGEDDIAVLVVAL